MSDGKLRWLGFGLLASAGAGVLTLASVMNAAFVYGEAAPPGGPPFIPNPDVTVADIMGPSGTPIPQEAGQYMGEVFTRYLQPNFPNLTFTSPCTTLTCGDVTGLYTPENLYPLTGVKTLPLDVSVSEGVTILNLTTEQQLTTLPPGDDLGVFGWSQSAALASLEMEQLDPSGTPSTDPVDFVLIGNPMNPNGGFLERFPGLNLASIGLTFYGATPANDFPTTIYTGEYDGYADFPRYPIDVMSDLNAFFGIFYVHGAYPGLTAAQLDSAFTLPTQGATETTYYMIPTTDLPLLDPLRTVPVIGNPLADLLQPDLTYLVNLGYGDPLYGYSTSAANVPTPFGLFPSLSDFEQLPGLLASGTEQGIQNFIGDLTGIGPNPVTLGSLSSLTSLLDPSSRATSTLA
ncbi:MAG: PE-PPE domain-containing protein, partial [Mycobacterium sp.]